MLRCRETNIRNGLIQFMIVYQHNEHLKCIQSAPKSTSDGSRIKYTLFGHSSILTISHALRGLRSKNRARQPLVEGESADFSAIGLLLYVGHGCGLLLRHRTQRMRSLRRWSQIRKVLSVAR